MAIWVGFNVKRGMAMNHYDVIVLQAFLAALRRLDQKLPADIQAQLQALAKSLAADEGEVIKLDAIAALKISSTAIISTLEAMVNEDSENRISDSKR